jgi:hypothetical protein
MKSIAIKLICLTVLATSLTGCIIIDRSGADHLSYSYTR